VSVKPNQADSLLSSVMLCNVMQMQCKYDEFYSTVCGRPLLGNVIAISNALNYRSSTISSVFLKHEGLKAGSSNIMLWFMVSKAAELSMRQRLVMRNDRTEFIVQGSEKIINAAGGLTLSRFLLGDFPDPTSADKTNFKHLLDVPKRNRYKAPR